MSADVSPKNMLFPPFLLGHLRIHSGQHVPSLEPITAFAQTERLHFSNLGPLLSPHTEGEGCLFCSDSWVHVKHLSE